ncbi:hypothetical protein P4H82_27765 [Bacillus cereus]|nr:hypothetical protein [Bacillus cereus]MEB9190683.1 hypothetical protein [Bacillus cereus]
MRTELRRGQLISSTHLPAGKFVITDVWEQMPMNTVGNRTSSYENKFKAIQVNEDGTYVQPKNQIEFSTCGVYRGSISEGEITIHDELEVVFLSKEAREKLNADSLKTTNAMYTVSASLEYNSGDSTTLYAGFSNEEADKAVKDARGDYEDFYKEIWVDGVKVRSYYKAYSNSEWQSEAGDIDVLSVETLAALNNLEIAIKRITRTKEIKDVLPEEEQDKLEKLIRDTFGQAHAMSSSLEGIRVPN